MHAALGGDRMVDLDPEIGEVGDQALPERGIALDLRGEFAGEGAVAVRELGHVWHAEFGRGQRLAGRQRPPVRGAARQSEPQARLDAVDGLLGHRPVRGQLAADEREHAGLGLDQPVTARQLDGRIAGVGRGAHQGPDAGPGADDAVVAEPRARHDAADQGEELVGVGRGDASGARVALVGGVGGAEVSPGAPGHDEQDPPLLRGLDDDGLTHRQVLGAQDHVDPPREAEQLAAGHAEQALGGPGPGRHQYGAGPHPGAVAELGDVVGAVPAERAHRRVGQHLGPVAAGVLQRGQGQAGVVGDGILVGDRAAEPVRGEQGLELAGGGRSEGAMAAAAVEAERVVEGQADPELPQGESVAAVGGEQELARLDQVTGDLVEASALAQGLVDEPDLALLEVADAAVDQSARARRCAKGQVTGVDDQDPQAAHGRVAGDTGARDAGADDQQVPDGGGRRRGGGRRVAGPHRVGRAWAPGGHLEAVLQGADLPGSPRWRGDLFGEGIGAIVAPRGGHL